MLVAQKRCWPRDVEVLHEIDGVALADCAQRRQVSAKVEGQFIGTRLAQQTGVGAEARAQLAGRLVLEAGDDLGFAELLRPRRRRPPAWRTHRPGGV